MARKRISAEFKAKVAFEAAKEVKTLNELASQYGVHPAQISQWKRAFLDGMPGVFAPKQKTPDQTKKIDELYRQIGEVTTERDWLRKKLEGFR